MPQNSRHLVLESQSDQPRKISIQSPTPPFKIKYIFSQCCLIIASNRAWGTSPLFSMTCSEARRCPPQLHPQFLSGAQ